MQFLENKMQEQLDHTISIFDNGIIFHPSMVTEIYNIATVRRRLH